MIPLFGSCQGIPLALEPVKSRLLARFMEIKKCAADDPNKCSIGAFSLDSHRIIYNWRYSDYERGILHGRCSKRVSERGDS